MGGLFAGFLGAGLLGMLMGNGFLGGLGGLGLDVRPAAAGRHHRDYRVSGVELVAAPQPAGDGQRSDAAQINGRNVDRPADRHAWAASQGAVCGGNPCRRLELDARSAEDFSTFERILGEVQTAYGREDVAALRNTRDPGNGVVYPRNSQRTRRAAASQRHLRRKLEQGDLSEAWREGDADYATVAMRYSLDDSVVDPTAAAKATGGTR